MTPWALNFWWRKSFISIKSLRYKICSEWGQKEKFKQEIPEVEKKFMPQTKTTKLKKVFFIEMLMIMVLWVVSLMLSTWAFEENVGLPHEVSFWTLAIWIEFSF